MTSQNPSTDFIPYPAALAHVEAREGALAERLLRRALAAGLGARGYVVHLWPPFAEGIEPLAPELFTSYGPQAPPAQIQRDGSAIMRGWSHPHFECRVLSIELNKAELLARWPGPLKRESRRPSLARLVKQAEQASGRRVTSITAADGTKLDFTEQQRGNELVDQWIANHADETQGH